MLGRKFFAIFLLIFLVLAGCVLNVQETGNGYKISTENKAKELDTPKPEPDTVPKTPEPKQPEKDLNAKTQETPKTDDTKPVEPKKDLKETSVSVGELKYEFAKVLLNSTKNNIDKIQLRFTNNGSSEIDIGQDVGFKLKNSKGEVVGERASSTVLVYNFVGIGYDSFSAGFSKNFEPGIYKLAVEFYSKGTNTVVASMEKELELGPLGEASQLGNTISVLDTKAENSFNLGSVRYSFDSIRLNSTKNNIDKINLRIENTGSKSVDVKEVNVKYLILDSEGKLLNARTSTNSILIYNLI